MSNKSYRDRLKKTISFESAIALLNHQLKLQYTLYLLWVWEMNNKILKPYTVEENRQLKNL